MNFDNIPELHWTAGYPFALRTTIVLGVALYSVFIQGEEVDVTPASA